MSNIKGKVVKIDWFQVTFDFITVKQISPYYYDFDLYQKEYKDLLDIFKRPERLEEIQNMPKGMFGYTQGKYIDEHIYLSYGGKKTANETYPMTLTMTGQGCRTFEVMGGNWIELFKYFQSNGGEFLRIGRIDIAFDDFEGKEITPYDIYPMLRNRHCVTQFRKVNLIDDFEFLGDSIGTSGYTITLGRRGSNQLQIYDKRLERNAMDEYDLDTTIWYRYEMRFTDEKARQVMDFYTASVIENNSSAFMEYACSLLLSCLDLKVPDLNDDNRSRWKTDPRWVAFLEDVKKIDLNTKHKIDTTIERKINWYDKNMASTVIDLFIAYGMDPGEFLKEMLDLISKGKYERKHLNRVNNYLREQGKELLSMEDIKKIQLAYSGLKPAIKVKKSKEDKS